MTGHNIFIFFWNYRKYIHILDFEVLRVICKDINTSRVSKKTGTLCSAIDSGLPCCCQMDIWPCFSSWVTPSLESGCRIRFSNAKWAYESLLSSQTLNLASSPYMCVQVVFKQGSVHINCSLHRKRWEIWKDNKHTTPYH